MLALIYMNKQYIQQNALSKGGACGYGDLDEAGYGRDTTGLSSALFGRGGACGVCFEIRCVDHIQWCLQVFFVSINRKSHFHNSFG